MATARNDSPVSRSRAAEKTLRASCHSRQLVLSGNKRTEPLSILCSVVFVFPKTLPSWLLASAARSTLARRDKFADIAGFFMGCDVGMLQRCRDGV